MRLTTDPETRAPDPAGPGAPGDDDGLPSQAETIAGAAATGRRAAAPRRFVRGDAIGRYVVLGTLGAGSMGVVYSAYDPQLDRRVAIKLLRFEPDDADGLGRQGLLGEAQAMARITHPNVVTVHDVGTDEGRVYVAMEFIEGQTLRAWLEGTPHPWRAVVDVFTRAGHGLRAAHAEGLVHRDFKPDNVMVATDGRVVVMDFGLALGERTSSAADDELLAERRSVITTHGSGNTGVVGTPAYMSPEQLGGGVADARSDQFSFCVALFTGLFGVPPYRAERIHELAFAIAGGRLTEVPAGVAVPGFVRRAVERGLRPEPGDRWPSMDALLAALDDRWIRRRRARLGAVGAVVGLGALASVAWWSMRGPEPCSGARERLAGLWDDTRRAEVEAVVAALDAPWAATTSEAAIRGLDAYADGWIDAHTEACRATTVYGAQSEALMDLRMGCLDRARMDLQAAVEQLATADPEVLTRAHDLVGELPELHACADVERLRDQAPPVLAPAQTAELQALQLALASARATHLAGRYADADAILGDARARVDALGQAPLTAEHRVLSAAVLGALGRGAVGQLDGDEGLRLAMAVDRTDLALRAAISLVQIVATDLRRPAEGLIYANVAIGLAERGGHARDLADAHEALGSVLSVAGRAAEAETAIRAALAFDPRDDPARTASMREGLAGQLLAAGHDEDGLAEMRAAMAIAEAALGPEHPGLVTFHQGVANALYALHRYPEADAAYRRALTIATGALGDEHPSAIGARFGLATQLAVAERFDEAEIEFRALLVTIGRTMGETSPRSALVRSNLAATLDAADRHEQAAAEARRALAIYATTLGEDHAEAASATSTLGRSLAALGRHDEAAPYLQRAVELRERTLGPDDPQVGRELMRWGTSLLALGEHADAVTSLERATRIFERDPDAARQDLALARFALAQAVSTAEPARARALAEQALEHLPTKTRPRAEAWLHALSSAPEVAPRSPAR